MSSVRDTRTRLPTAAAAVVIAVLSLAACGDGSASGKYAKSGVGSGYDGDAPTGHSGGGGNKAVVCGGSGIKTVAAPVNRPVNHMLLTVTNTGSAPCDLYGYPAVRFGKAQSVPPVNEDSKPRVVVRLAPGESGYAAVNLSATDGSGTNGRTVKSLAVTFQDRAGEDTSWAAHPPLPAKGLYVDDSLSVTYWQQSMDNALSW
ncbi:DUF4232 domain-containing protein [Streptomyces sp. NPDC097640]|uniref:DUF4232 domain-containing protein n=1 Tax=Streptomyces sp. NPDC097640 TaxID=3157229 RepID=UPI0033255889